MRDFQKENPDLYKANYDGTNTNQKNVWISLNKMFVTPKLTIDEKVFQRAYRLIKSQMRLAFLPGLQYNPEFTQNSVPGAWWKYYGFKSKQEVFECPTYYTSQHECRSGLRHYPPYVAAGKRELLSHVELQENKIRTFLMASTELLADEKYLYGNQDEGMKTTQPGWVRYGINFHDGGFDRMIKAMLRTFYFQWDVAKWDRQLAILDRVQQMRNELLQETLPPELWELVEPITERVTSMVVNHDLLLPDGYVVRWPWSQMSGDGMTTSNNCLAHSLIFCYLLIQACPNATDKELLDAGANLYSDDIMGGLDDQFSKIRDYDFTSSVYSHFGLTIKDGTFRIQETPIGLEFLGATVKAMEIGGEVYFVPAYKKERVLSGLQISTDRLNADDELMKVFSLLQLGWYDCYNEIAPYVLYLLRKVPDSPVKRSFLKQGLPSRDTLMSRWAGVSEER